MKAIIVLCVALVVSGHPHIFHETPLVKGVHKPLPLHVRMLPLPSYAAPQVIRIEQPEAYYTTQPPPVVHEHHYGYGPPMPEEQHVAPCPKHHRSFASPAPVRIQFGDHMTGPHTHGPGPMTLPSHDSSHKVISKIPPWEHSFGGNDEESSGMIVHEFLRPSMAAPHDFRIAQHMISGMTSGKAQASGTTLVTNLLDAAHRKGSLDVPQVSGRVPPENSLGNQQIFQRGEVLEDAEPHIPVLRFDEEILEGHHHSFNFDAANGIHQDDITTVEHIPGGPGECDKAIVRKTGSFSYIAPDGQQIKTTYVADENGYRVRGDHLPTPPPIPEAIQRSLDELKSKGRL